MRQLSDIAAAKGVAFDAEEGARDTKILFNGSAVTTAPRHNEINEVTAKNIIRQAKGA